MKKTFTILSLLTVLLSCHLTADAQESEQQGRRRSQFAVGIENTRLVYGKYTYNEHLTVKLNLSAYSEKIAYQYVRATVGYRTTVSNLNLEGSGFWGSSFNGFYYNAGAKIAGDMVLAKRLILETSLVPWYDSGYKYTTCWDGKVGCIITYHINIKMGYTTIPEYRMSEKRLIGSLDFHVSNLYVTPYITVGTKSSAGGRNIRVGFGFEYRF